MTEDKETDMPQKESVNFTESETTFFPRHKRFGWYEYS